MAESIYKFVEQPKPEEPKKEIYRSKFDPKGPLIGSTFCMQGTTAVDGKGFHSLKKVGVSGIFVTSCSSAKISAHYFIIAPEPRRDLFHRISTRKTGPKAVRPKGFTEMQRQGPTSFRRAP